MADGCSYINYYKSNICKIPMKKNIRTQLVGKKKPLQKEWQRISEQVVRVLSLGWSRVQSLIILNSNSI